MAAISPMTVEVKLPEVLNAPAMMGVALHALACDQSEWSQKVFGSDAVRGPLGPLKHLAKEAMEAHDAYAQQIPTGVETEAFLAELSDCLILLLDATRRSGHSISEVIEAAQTKMHANRSRTWPEFDPAKVNQAVEHIKG